MGTAGEGCALPLADRSRLSRSKGEGREREPREEKFGSGRLGRAAEAEAEPALAGGS